MPVKFNKRVVEKFSALACPRLTILAVSTLFAFVVPIITAAPSPPELIERFPFIANNAGHCGDFSFHASTSVAQKELTASRAVVDV
jgi:hypothetical protein